MKPRRTNPLIERIMRRCQEVASGCWEWSGPLRPAGHPYNEENTRTKRSRDGYERRVCITCTRKADRERQRAARSSQ